MLVTFKPADGDTQSFEYDPEDVLSSAAVEIEKRFGASWEQFGAAVLQGSMRARRVLLWHLMRAVHPALRFEDLPDFRARELVVEFSSDELRAIRDRIAKANLPQDEREQLLTALDFQVEEAVTREGGEAPGKADSSNSAESTG